MYGYETFHDKIMLDLISAVRSGQARHAYIFEGAEGLALESSSRLFAAALTCTSQDAPCGECHCCKMSIAGTNPDIITVTAGGKKSIGVDEIRGVVDDAYVKPFNSTKKVYILPNAALMTVQAQNAFLKTLEEPPECAVFILITQDEENLLQTIRSRCITVRFPRVSEEVVRRYVNEKYPNRPNSEFLIKYAEGIPHSVDAIADDAEFDELRRGAFDTLARLMSNRNLDAYDAAEFLEKNKERASDILNLWLSFVRDIILIQQDCTALAVNTDFLVRLERAANTFDEARTVRVQQRLIKAVRMLKRYVNIRALSLWLALGE